MTHFKMTPLAVGLALACSAQVWAEATPVHQLGHVHVTATKANIISPLYINETTIERTPNATESVTGLLRPVSSVQFSDDSQQSGEATRLAPPLVSIRGTRPFESAYLINGMSNNNVLSPGKYSDTQYGVLPKNGPEVIWLDPDLIEEVSLYSDNISAAYGGFLGGVVDAQLKTPNRKKWTGALKTSYTDNHLTRQFFEGDDQGVADRASFRRYQAGFSLEGPIKEEVLSARIAVDLLRSTKPVYTNEEEGIKDKTQNRINALLGLSAKIHEDWTSDLTVMYSPVINENYAPDNRHGKFTTKLGGMNALWRNKFDTRVGTLTVDAGWMRQQMETDATSDVSYQWATKVGGKPSRYATWSNETVANEGLLGDQYQRVDTLSLKPTLDAKTFEALGMSHTIKTGAEVVMHRARGHESKYTSFSKPIIDSKVVGTIENGVIEHEQYATLMSVRMPRDVRRNVTQMSAFFEDTLEWKRLELRPGVRVSYDSVVKKVNVAPRFKATVDVLGTGAFKVIGGWNRYYGDQLIGLALRGLNPPLRYSRTLNSDGTVSDWTAGKPAAGNVYDFGKLKTPHSDEWVLGTEADVPYVGRVGLKGVVRHHKDQLTTTFDMATKTMTYANGGKSKYQGVTLDWQRSFDLAAAGRHDLKLGVTWSQTKGNQVSVRQFTEGVSSDMQDPYVLLDGEIVDRASMPAGTFNSPWVVTFSDSMSFWEDRLTGMLTLRYQKGGKHIEKQNGKTTVDGVKYDAFITKKSHANLYVDAQLEGVLYKAGDQSFALKVDVFNLLDRRNKSIDGGSFGLGRQIVLTGTYRF